MEATVVDMEAPMAEWNEGRVDDLSKRVDDLGANTQARFNRLEDKVDKGFAHLDAKFDVKFDAFSNRIDAKFDAFSNRIDAKFDAFGNRIDAKFDGLYQMLMKAAWGLAVGLLTMLGGLIALIATKF